MAHHFQFKIRRSRPIRMSNPSLPPRFDQRYVATDKPEGVVKEHFEGLGRIAEWAHRSGDSIVGGINENPNGERVRGYLIRRGGSLIYLESSQENTFATVTALWRITNALADHVPEEEVDNRVAEIQSGENTSRSDIRDSIAHDYIEEQQEWVNERVAEVVESKWEFESRLSYTTTPGENRVKDGFRIVQKIYPQDSTFKYRHYDEIVEEVSREQQKVGEVLSTGIEDAFSLFSEEPAQQIEAQTESQERNNGHGTAYQ